MAKVICALSGLEFKVEHFPCLLDSRECWHPVFDIPAKQLPRFYNKYVRGELTETDSYLLFLALIRSSELVDWRVPIKMTEKTASIVANNMEHLFNTTAKIAGIKHPAFAVPQIAITQDTCTLDNIRYWLSTWDDAYVDFLSGLKSEEYRTKLVRRETALEKLIKSPQLNPAKYARILAGWASEAGTFPDFTISYENGETAALSEYWQDIIVACYNTENIMSVPPKDLQELIDHCESNIDSGTIFSHQLFAALEEGKSRQSNFFGFGDMKALSSDNPGFRILDAETSVEDANLLILINSAPENKPERKNYPSDFAFLKAKSKYDMAQKYKQTPPDTPEIGESNA